MTPSEFKAWFEGFTESIDGPPSLKQWEKIQARVKQITGEPVTYPVYVDRYWSRPKPWWEYDIHRFGVNTCMAVGDARLTAAAAPAIPHDVITMKVGGREGVGFDSHVAMAALGHADAADLACA